MAITVKELREWLGCITDEDTLLAIDEGGLTLYEIDHPEYYTEIGGNPDGEE
jgi:hypothetical protein